MPIVKTIQTPIPDNRRWKIVSDYLGNDTAPYTTQEINDYLIETDYGDLIDQGDRLIDMTRGFGNEGYVAAILINNVASEPPSLVCLRCCYGSGEKKWYQRTDRRPSSCPHCHSAKWDVPIGEKEPGRKRKKPI